MVRFLRLLAAVSLLCSPALNAQLEPLGAPKGTLRFELGGLFQSADSRYFDGQRQDYLADFGGADFGSNRMPFLAGADTLLGQVLGQPGYRLNLGRQRSNGQLTIGSGILGGALGLTSRLTIFARVPLVTTRVQASLRLDSATADAGLNPAHPTLGNAIGQNNAAVFFNTFDQALADLQARISGGTYAGNPALDSLARDIASRSSILRDQLAQVTNDPNVASPFLPSAGSATGQQLTAAIRGLSDTLVTTLGVGTALLDPVLAAGLLTSAEFTAFVADPLGPVGAFPLTESKISRAGDTEVGAIYTLIDRFDRPGTTGGFRLAVTGMMRLPTGQRDDPANLLDVGTGNGRYEVGVSGAADLGSRRWGVRLTGGYLVRLKTLRVRRVTSPDQPYAPATTLTNIDLDAGDILSLGARPFYRLARSLALSGSVDYWRAGDDAASYSSAADAIPGVSASVLAAQSGRSAVALGGGLSYVGRAVRECEANRRCGWPIEASWNYSTVIAATGGRVEKFRSTRLEIRWYQRLWR